MCCEVPASARTDCESGVEYLLIRPTGSVITPSMKSLMPSRKGWYPVIVFLRTKIFFAQSNEARASAGLSIIKYCSDKER